MPLRRQALPHGLDEPRLADAGLTAQDDRGSLAAAHLLPERGQLCQQVVAADDRAPGARGPGREAALRAAHPPDLIGLHRLRDALEIQ